MLNLSIFLTSRITLPDCTILDNLVFEKFTLADEPFEKALQNLKTCVSVNNSLFGKLVSSLESPVKFDEGFCAFAAQSRFLGRSISCIAFGSASSFCYLLKSIEIRLQYSLE